MRPRVRLLPVVLLAGCGISEERFPERFARMDCARHWQCDLTSYELAYSDFSDCVREDTSVLEDLKEFEDHYGCAYDPDAAAAAYDDLNSMTCEQWHAGELLLGFTAIWSCE